MKQRRDIAGWGGYLTGLIYSSLCIIGSVINPIILLLNPDEKGWEVTFALWLFCPLFILIWKECYTELKDMWVTHKTTKSCLRK